MLSINTVKPSHASTEKQESSSHGGPRTGGGFPGFATVAPAFCSSCWPDMYDANMDTGTVTMLALPH